MKGKIKATGEEVSVDKVCDYNNGTFYYSATNIDDDRTWESHEIEVEEHTEKVLEGWVARDEDGALNLFDREPERIAECAWAYFPGHSLGFSLPKESFPEVTWESEPLPVILTIKSKE